MSDNLPPVEMTFVDGAMESYPSEEMETNSIFMGRGEAAGPTSVTDTAWQYVSIPVTTMKYQLSHVQPWNDFFDREQMIAPDGARDAFSRVTRNANHFYHNYLVIAILGSLIVLIINPLFSVCMFFLLLAWSYVHKKQAEAAGTNITTLAVGNLEMSFLTAYALLSLIGLITFYVFGGSSILFWLVFASFGVVLIHAMMRKPPGSDDASQFL
uniref:PRA1 family protein n=1 Tax=Trypanosoma congolense (strain IL3000) TaxID=1068625 RepID=G0UXZ6_TRYCI|nr:putative RAB-interacting protein [Trypanosoma congolense IL3000]